MQKRYIPVALFFAFILMILAHFSGRALAVPASFTYADSETKKIYLTFDDGPSNSVTVPVLDTLKEEGVKATFFIVSDRVHGREDILKRTAAEGHTLGVHSASHDYKKIYASDEALLKDIDTCAAAIKRVTGICPTVYRFPGGSSLHKDKRELVKNHGYRVVEWNAVCGDEEIPKASEETLIKTSLGSAKNKKEVVLLLHDSASHKATANALGEIIRTFKSQGYTFCTF